jgi:hypothetical protein
MFVAQDDKFTSAPSGRHVSSSREFDPDKAGGPILNLNTDKIRITHLGINVAEKHISRFGLDKANQVMIERLRRIARGELKPTVQDKNFYAHELREFVRYRKCGYETGQPLTDEAQYELWNDTHTASLEDYGLNETKRSRETSALPS